MKKICAVYKITNTITNDFYIGSSKNVKRRWTAHKCPSTWNRCPNNPLYKDIKKFGLNNFAFEILAEIEIDKLKEKEQEFIEKMHPIYNNYNAKGYNFERCKEARKEYEKSEKRKKYKKQYDKQYRNQLCLYKGETLTLHALRTRFMRMGIDHPVIEAKKYLLQ